MAQWNAQTGVKAFWAIPELVAIAVDFLDVQSLSQCARVSRAVSEHALNSLYRKSARLTDIFGLLCPMRTDATTGTISFIVPLRPAHWTRFRHYNHRIQEVSVEFFDPQTRSISQKAIIDLLGTQPRQEPFLPSLRRLDWQDVHPSLNHLVILLFHEGLRELRISLDPSSSTSIMDFLPLRAPNLKFLQVWTTRMAEHDSQFHNATMEAIQRLPLVRLRMPPDPLSPGMLSVIAQKRELQSFWGYFFGPETFRPSTSESYGDSSDMTFPVLRECSVNCGDFLSGLDYFISAPQLVSLHINYGIQDNISTGLSMLSSLRLKDLMIAIRTWNIGGNQGPPPSPTIDVLRPILAMSSLEILVIVHPRPPGLSDEDIAELARSLPELRHIELCGHAREEPSEKVPTLECFKSLAQYCRKLISISIWIDASDPPPPISPNEMAFSSTLEVVYFHSSKIDRVWDVMAFLVSILPPLTILEWSPVSRHLRPVIGASEVHFHSLPSAAMNSCRSKWQEVSTLLSSRAQHRRAIQSQRSRIERERENMAHH
ncbi:hypothetical protein SISNIDRAFT_484403 [Sistotremastrum niveocremeum HHB9708]|uniref:F-box domain-containing protein n=2 Tax=Sistotremastraceae TaxID=3402574 RepID=A0A164WA68_9AGAM|nr:hypothetical protein SISNIDRAFT_484403 [Sistotremastrum niveocremeum HHB9708]KZT36881.1 hypothetical protein SISSUDRAFT_1063310 [Sistotremastrum suecicum HHB10207 ss-3]